MPYYLLAPTTDAADSKEIVCNHKAIPVHLMAPGLAGAETATLKKKSLDGNYYELDEMTADAIGKAINAPGIYLVSKSATASPVGIEASTDAKP